MTAITLFNADTAARALVASARLVGLNPLEIFKPDGRGGARTRGVSERTPSRYTARIVAAAALRATGVGTPTLLARPLGIHVPDMAPSALAKRGITTDQLLDVANAMPAVRS